MKKSFILHSVGFTSISAHFFWILRRLTWNLIKWIFMWNVLDMSRMYVHDSWKIWFLCNFPIKTTKSSFSMIVQFKPISYQRFHKKAFKTFCCSENYQISFAWIMLFCVHCILFICIVYMSLLTAMIGRIYPTFHVKVREIFRINFSLCFAKIHLLNKVFLTADEFALSHYTNFLVTISSC